MKSNCRVQQKSTIICLNIYSTQFAIQVHILNMLSHHMQYRGLCYLGSFLLSGPYSIPPILHTPSLQDLAICLASETEWALGMAHTITVVMKPAPTTTTTH